jgi:iron-sulfur cluster assembly protein
MLEATAMAVEKLNEYFKDNNLSSSLRVFVQQGGCSGPSLALALDEKKLEDEVYTNQEITFLVEKSLLKQCGDITIDFVDAGPRSGFSIRSTIPLPGGGGGCSSGSCGSQGCGC